MRRLRMQDTRPTGERGDILAMVPAMGLMVADVSVVHPPGAKYAQTAAQI
jgi:hypothetical protein